MKRKILIGLSVFFVILIGAFFYLSQRNRTLSPPGFTEIDNQGLIVRVDYSRPSVRGREIFGADVKEVLLPNGKYWRLGANEPTLLTVNQDFRFNGAIVPAGQYDMYAIPNDKEFEIRLNSGLRFWGVSEPDYKEDVQRIKVPVKYLKSNVEQFTITAIAEGKNVILQMMWADREWNVTISPK